MRKMIIEIEDDSKQKNDVLIYNGSFYTTLSKDAFLRDVFIKLNKLSEDLKNASERIENLEKQLRLDHGEDE